MGRLIDADTFRSNIDCCDIETYNDKITIIEQINEAPTVDAVVVVRCKDCTKNGLFSCPICFIENKTLQFVNHSPDFYCGEGERRTDG